VLTKVLQHHDSVKVKVQIPNMLPYKMTAKAKAQIPKVLPYEMIQQMSGYKQVVSEARSLSDGV